MNCIFWKSGLVPDTLETSATWENIWAVYAETRKAFYSFRQAKGFQGEIMAHLSHLYREGACIYFTFIIMGESELELLQELRDVLIRSFMATSVMRPFLPSLPRARSLGCMPTDSLGTRSSCRIPPEVSIFTPRVRFSIPP